MKKYKPNTYELQTAKRWRDLENKRGNDTRELAGAIFKAQAGQALEWRDWDKIRSAVAKWEGVQISREIILEG